MYNLRIDRFRNLVPIILYNIHQKPLLFYLRITTTENKWIKREQISSKIHINIIYNFDKDYDKTEIE